jgi:prevent-host-death family protein
VRNARESPELQPVADVMPYKGTEAKPNRRQAIDVTSERVSHSSALRGNRLRFLSTNSQLDRSDIINAVAYRDECIVLTRHGKPVAAIVSLLVFEALKDIEDKIDREGARRARADVRKHGKRKSLFVYRVKFSRPATNRERPPMDIKRVGSQPSSKGPAEYFSGTVRIDPLFDRTDPARVSGATVTFEPAARTAWHTHPLGQTLVVVSGCGRVQRWGGAVEEIHPGDVVIIAPGEKHWHGAAPTTAMTHFAVQEKLNGKPVDWMEQVSDEQYQAAT